MKIPAILSLLVVLGQTRQSFSECTDPTSLAKGLRVSHSGECIQCTQSSKLDPNFFQFKCTCEPFSGFDSDSGKCQKCPAESLAFQGACRTCQIVIILFLFIIFKIVINTNTN
jgi:hypothetical protein